MNFFLLINKQVATLKKAVAYYSVAIVLLAGIALQPYTPNQVLTKDALKVAGGEFYYGFLSNVGILIWCGAAFICFFSAQILKKTNHTKNQRFLLHSGLLSFLFLVDDMFQLHDQAFPDYLGVDQNLILSLYPVATVSFLFYFRKRIFETSYLTLLSSMAFLGLSITLDTLVPRGPFILEDGFKFLGIVGWFCYYFDTCKGIVFNSLRIKKVNKIKIREKVLDLKEA